ncbi:MAG: LacI family DNA-binding transcriptional regulator [Gemmatimonadales bacterium]
MVTIREVARGAGVSVATVSRVYNHSHHVREETRQRVRRTVQHLGYSPHGAARSLVTNRTHTIGVLLPDLYGEFFSELIRGIDQAAQARGYHLLVSSARSHGDSPEPVLRSMRGRVDGLILMTPDLDAASAGRSLPAGFPVVLLNCPPSDAPCDSLGIANFEGARAMIRHLATVGHRRIAIICGDARNFDAAERLRGYRAAVAELGLEADPALELPGDFSEAAGHAAGRRILDEGRRPTAVFGANDCMTIGALSAFRAAGLRVPEDIALAGFDDIPMAQYVDPALTSVHVDISELGRLATERLLDALREPAPRSLQRQTLNTTLVVRRSCGAGLA